MTSAVVYGAGRFWQSCFRPRPVRDVECCLSATVNVAGDRSIEAGFILAPIERPSLNLSDGQLTGAGEAADLRGTLLNAGARFNCEGAGAALSYNRFDDSSNYQSSTLGGRLTLAAGDIEISALGRRPEMGVT